MKIEIEQLMANMRQVALPFHPIIFVFATGQVSEDDCLPMQRVPMPKVGAPLDSTLIHTLEKAYAENPSIHDGAIVFVRDDESQQYQLTAWSMRIVSKQIPHDFEPNLGSAHNSAISLSMGKNIDMCCIASPSRTTFFENGKAKLVAS